MKREFLKGFELSDEIIDKIMAENGKDIQAVKAKASDYQELKAKLEDAMNQISEIETIKKEARDYKQMVESLKFDHALERALAKAGAKNSKAVKALLDLNALKLEEGEIPGLGEQIEKVKAENHYLFDSGASLFQVVLPQEGEEEEAHAIRAAMGLK